MGLNPPKRIDYLNFANQINENPESWFKEPMSIQISLSNKVVKQKRIVYDIYMLFTDVGGFYDFLKLVLTICFSYVSVQFQRASMV